jgi:hypothetical protein
MAGVEAILPNFKRKQPVENKFCNCLWQDKNLQENCGDRNVVAHFIQEYVVAGTYSTHSIKNIFALS